MDRNTEATLKVSGPVGIIDLTESKRRKKAKRRFVMTFVDVDDFTLDERLSFFDKTLVVYLARRMDTANEVRLKQAEIAAEMKVNQARVSRGVSALREADYITTEGYGVIRLNPHFFWRSAVSENEKLVKLDK